MNPVIMHINYCEQTFHSYGTCTVDDVCRIAAELGFDGIEFRGKPPKELAHLSFWEYAEQIAAAKKKYGLTEILFGCGIPGCMEKDREVRERSIAEAIEKAQIVNDLCGTTLCNTSGAVVRSSVATAPADAYEFHGSAAAPEEAWEMTAEAFHRLGDVGEKLGMKFGFETHMSSLTDLPAPTMKLVNMIGSPAIGVNMDYGNTVYFPKYPSLAETIALYGDKLFYTHLKNSVSVPGTGKQMPTALGDGAINHREYLSLLKERGFTGPIGIEAPRSGDRLWFARQDFAYFKAVWAEV